MGRRVDPALLLWRLERLAHAGDDRLPPVLPARCVAPGAHGLRGGDRPGGDRPVWKDARDRAARLCPRSIDRGLGRESLGVGNPSGADPPGGTAPGCEAGGGRSTPHAARQEGRLAPGAASRHRPATGALDPPLSLRGGQGGLDFPERARARRGGAAAAGAALDVRAGGGGHRRARGGHRASGADVRGGFAGGDPCRLGAGAQPQWRLGRGGGSRAAGGGGKVRCPRRRLHLEQLRRLCLRPAARPSGSPSPRRG